MAAEFVSSAFLSASVQALLDRLAPKEVTSLFRGEKLVVNQLEDLKIMLLSADTLLDDAEAKQIEDSNVRNWFDELKEVVYLAGELMDKIDNEALERKLEGESGSSMSKVLSKLVPSSLNAFNKDVRSEMNKILLKLRHLVEQSGPLGLNVIIREKKHLNRLPAPSVKESDVYGRESDKEAIVESLLSDDVTGHNVSVIPIVGLGGIGKTTLAQLVYDDPRVKKHFHEPRVWVTISAEFDLFRITKNFFDKVTSQYCSPLDLQEVCFQLKEALAKKKFLIVLDEVWNWNYKQWDVLRSALISGMRGSKIIVTTRNATVASIMATQQPHYLPELSEEDCWRIFTNHAFIVNETLEEFPSLEEIGKEIVKSCKGNPLAAKLLGGVLHSERNPRKWEELLKSNMWELNGIRSGGIFSVLQLCYHYLPSYLKQCFAYCSLFPKHYFFQREELILLWMAEGFLQPEAARNRIEDVGEKYFEDLLSRSLFQRSKEYEMCFVMHDLVHDLAMHVSGEFVFHLDEDKLLHGLATKTRHYSCSLVVDDLKKFEGVSKAKRLHTYIQFKEIKLREPADYLILLTTIGCLRVLSLHGFNIKEVPDSIGNLKNLRYLDFSETNVVTLPDSVCSLYNLQALILWSCTNLSQLPINMGRLINLRHLHTGRSALEEMPLHMGNLKNLETLSDFVLCAYGGSNIKELGKLQHLHGTLRISGLENVHDIESAAKANLKEKNLNVLALEWKGLTDDTKYERDLLQTLEPQTNLREVVISGYGGTSFPFWVGDSAYSKMVSIELRDCRYCYVLPTLGQLPFLNMLKIYGFDAVMDIGDEFYGGDSPFRSLQMLRFENMPKWIEWSSFEGNKDGAFPCLKTLHLINCPNLLGGLPITSHTIETLTIKNCGKLGSPSNHHVYTSLRELNIESCQSFKCFPLENAPKLNQLHLSDCESFESLTFMEEPLCVLQCLHLMRLSGLPTLVSFPKGGLPAPNLKQLTISGCENLRLLPEQMNWLLPSLEGLEVKDCPEIKSFPEGGLPSNLKILEIRGCRELISRCMHWDLQKFTTSLESLMIGGCKDVLESFPPEGLLPSSVTSFSIVGFPHLKALDNNIFQHLSRLGIYSCPELQCLPEEGLLNSIKFLNIYECPLLELRYRKEKGKGWPKISQIPSVWITGSTTSNNESDTH